MISKMPPTGQKYRQEQQATRRPQAQPIRIAAILNKKAPREAHKVSRGEKPTPRPTAILSKESAIPSERASTGLKSLSQFLSACFACMSQEESKTLMSPKANRRTKPAIRMNRGEIIPVSRLPIQSDSISVMPEIAERMNKEETGILTRLIP